jgi:uncharacterized protein YggT (Ycf19 family)
MALVLLVVQQILFIAALLFVAQLGVGLFRWSARKANPIWRLFDLLLRPLVNMVRAVLPRRVSERGAPLVAFWLCLVLYLAAGFANRDLCRADLSRAGCDRWVAARALNGDPPPPPSLPRSPR